MKQVSKSIKSCVLSSPRFHSIPQQKAFSNYHLFSLLAGFLILISSCQKDELQGSLQKQEIQANSQKQDLLNSSLKQDDKNECVPFKGKFTQSYSATGVIGTGEGSHIGRFTLYASKGTSTITAANGDQIFITFTVLKNLPLGNGMAQIDLNNTITGGTGRFAGATGSFEMHALKNVILDTGSATFDGMICY
ncbi:MAG: hypothetical protein ABIN89_12255 [Chitinophagaceae bacterium]